MRYGDVTNEQFIAVLVAVIAPLVWAFTHHGRTRMITLMLWAPLWLFIARIIYMNPLTGAPVELRLRYALRTLLIDPLTIAWPVFVLLVYGLIWLFTMPRRRREAKAQAAAWLPPPTVSASTTAQPAVPVSTLPPLWREEKPSEPEPFKRCDRCGYWGLASATSCPGCHHVFDSSEKSALPKAGPYTLPAEKRKTCPKCDMIVASWANHCPACQYSFAQAPSPASAVESSWPSPKESTPPAYTKSATAVVEQMRLLGELRDDGLLTEDEFQAKKAELLSRI